MGEINGVHEKDDTVDSGPRKISLPCKGKIVRIEANNSRSVAMTDRGEIWYWGGMRYPREGPRERLTGFHLLTEEPDVAEMLKRGEKIVEYRAGLAHELLLTEANI